MQERIHGENNPNQVYEQNQHSRTTTITKEFLQRLQRKKTKMKMLNENDDANAL